jgi:hypothetical protein
MARIPVREADAIRREMQVELKKQLAIMVSSAFALVAALFWNDAIKAFITSPSGLNIPTEGSWVAMMVAAVIVTIVAVLATITVSKMLGAKK